MPDVSSAESPPVAAGAGAGAPTKPFSVSSRARVAMIGMGFIPALHLAAAASPLVLMLVAGGGAAGLLLVPVGLYVIPPLAVRFVLWLAPLPAGQIDLDSRAFLTWWFTAQWQILFNRFPGLEELLRVMPGLYSAWLRLWGARVGTLVYWSPGLAIADRPFLEIGDRVMFGLGVRINAHAIAPGRAGGMALLLGPVSIGPDVLVGGYSLLLPGVCIAPGEVTPPFRSLHAFTRWEGGRRTEPDSSRSSW